MTEMATDYEEFNAKITAHGNSLTINCTAAIKRMGLGRGDLVRVRIERIPAKE